MSVWAHNSLSRALCIGCLALGMGCGAGGAEAPSKAAALGAAPPREVRVTAVREIEMARSLVLAGTLAADDRALVSVKVPGRVASVAVDLGTVVTRGQALAKIESADYALRVEQARSALAQVRALLGLPPESSAEQVELERTSLVRQARAARDQAKLDLDRARTLAERSLIGRADLEVAQTKLIEAETALEAAQDEIRNRQALLRQRKVELSLAQQQLADTTLRSPLDGVVEQKSTSVGEYVAVGAPVATVVRIDPLRMRVEVPERDAGLLRVDLPVRVTVDEMQGTFEGKVARLSPSLNEQNRTLTVEADIVNPGTLRPGSFARAELSLPGHDRVLAVPPSAIVRFAGIEKVIGVADGKAVERTVTTGEESDGLVAVLSGLSAGELVVIEPGNLQEGQPVHAAGP